MLFRDNFIIRLVLVYRPKEMCVSNKANHSSPISSSDIQLSPIYVHLRKEYKHIFCVFSRKQEFQVCNLILLFFSQRAFAKKNKSIKLQTLREE